MRISEFRDIAKRRGLRLSTAVVLFSINLVGTLFESLGLGMLLPVFQFIQSNADIRSLTAEHEIWRILVDLFAWVGVPLTVSSLLLTSFVCILSRQIFLYGRLVWTSVVKSRLIRDLCNHGFDRYLRTTSAYRDREYGGNVVNSLTTELNLAIDTLFAPVTLANLVTMALLYVAIMAMLSPLLTLGAIIVLGLSALPLRRLMVFGRRLGREMADANRSMSAFLVERLKSSRLISLSGTEAAEAKNMQELTARQCTRNIQISALQAGFDVVIEPVVVGIGFVFLLVGTTRFNLKVEEIGLFLVIVIRLLPLVKDFMKIWQGTVTYFGCLEALDRRLCAMEAAQEMQGGAKCFAGLRDGIDLSEVEFSYPEGGLVPALRGVSLRIPAAKMTALVGPSGSGKSTLIDLLPRFREPTKGAVLFDGIPVAQYSLNSLRAGIAYVPQSPQIFNVTAAEHIRYGNPDATEEEIRRAARLAGAEEFILALPHAFETRLGEEGVRLSGGQRQRLDLARALVRRSPILILDEPTSNLDADAEGLLRTALWQIRRETDITIIIVGHRLSTVTEADLIVVLSGGQVEDRGTHTELMARGRWYAQAFKKQQGEVLPFEQALEVPGHLGHLTRKSAL